jgi:hypothetical protein
LEVEQYRIELDEEVRRKFDVPLRSVKLKGIDMAAIRTDDSFREAVYA